MLSLLCHKSSKPVPPNVGADLPPQRSNLKAENRLLWNISEWFTNKEDCVGLAVHLLQKRNPIDYVESLAEKHSKSYQVIAMNILLDWCRASGLGAKLIEERRRELYDTFKQLQKADAANVFLTLLTEDVASPRQESFPVNASCMPSARSRTVQQSLAPFPLTGCQSARQLENHDDYSCNETCPYRNAGCDFEGHQFEVFCHMQQSVEQHACLSMNLFKTMTQRIQNAELQIEQLSTKLEAQVEYSQQLKHTVEKLENDHDVSAMNAALHHLNPVLAEATNFNGSLAWKICFEEARMGRTPLIDIPPFYTSHPGYNICTRIYVHRDNVGKVIRLSLFFVMMRGEFDAFLSWPFQQMVAVTVLDQSPHYKHACRTFTPDPSSNSFQRPTTEMNIASDCPNVVFTVVSDQSPKSGAQHIKDDAIYVKIAIAR